MSRMPMTWVKAVSGRLKNRYRYSAGLCYNTFSIPELSTQRKNEIMETVYKMFDILNELNEKK